MWAPDPLIVLALIVLLLVIAAAVLLAYRRGKLQFSARKHVHRWQHVATEWNAGKEVHVMVCWQHTEPATERIEVT